MAQLWGGRFTKETDKLVYNFNASISFDKKFYKQDMEGSMAHVRMLAKQGILTEGERDAILAGIQGIQADVESGKLEITDEYEDIHSFVEAVLIDRIGEPGKKLHTGRSRNDQVALDMKLYTRDELKAIDALVRELLSVLLRLMKEHTETIMPGFTHLQKAQPELEITEQEKLAVCIGGLVHDLGHVMLCHMYPRYVQYCKNELPLSHEIMSVLIFRSVIQKWGLAKDFLEYGMDENVSDSMSLVSLSVFNSSAI